MIAKGRNDLQAHIDEEVIDMPYEENLTYCNLHSSTMTPLVPHHKSLNSLRFQ